MEIDLSVYPNRNRRRKKSLKLEVVTLKAEVAQLQHRHNQLLKALLALSQGATINTSVYRTKLAVTNQSEADFISQCFGVDPEDDDLLTMEEEILNLLEG